jgi:hypothetical protein
VFGRKELDQLALERRALVAESGLNRLVLRAEIQHLRSATAWVSEAARWPRKAGPLLLVLAPLAGFLLTRVSRREGSWFRRLSAAAKWIGPLYTLWQSFSARREEAEAGEPAA